ncbi:MAG: carbohydrate ABC transporter permease [Pseudomonadota bacterium]
MALGSRPGGLTFPMGVELRRFTPTNVDKQIRYTLSSLVAIVVAMIFLFPLFWGISTSLRPPLETFTVSGFGIPWINFTPTLDNWIDQLKVPETQQALYNSTVIASLSTLLALAIGTPAAYGLARFRFEIVPNRDITIFFLAQRILPPVATVIPFYLMMSFLGLLNTHLGLILVNATFILPFVVVILRQGFLDLPIELEESAMVDGADNFGAFMRVALPLVAPVIAATGLIIFGKAWNEFLFAVAIASKNTITIPVHMAGTAGTRGVFFWYLAVRQMIAIVPPVLIALIAQRYIVRGLTMGAIRG